MEQKLANIETAIAELQRKTSQIRGILTVVGHSGKTLTMNDNLNVIELLKRVSDLEDLIHERLHSIVSTLDHSSSATAGSILKADENGLPVEAAAADVEGSHTHSKIVASDGSPDAVTADADGNITVSGKITSQSGRIINTTLVNTSPYTILDTDEVVDLDTDGGAITANLPAGVDGTHYKVSNCGSSGNNVTLTPNGAETLFGSASATILYDGEIADIHFKTSKGWW
jgi:hypothetical protein